MKTMRKRASALIVSAVMAASTLSVMTAGSLPVLAAGSASSINKVLPTAISSDDPDKPQNQTDCTFQCAAKTDKYTEWTDTNGSGPATFLGTDSVKTLQFNFKSEDYVTQMSYYFGCAADKAHGYWWDYKDPETKEAYECHPYAKEFSIVIEVPEYANFADKDGKFQIQNCYTATINEETKKTVEGADITLVSIVANGTEDTSEGEKLPWIPSPPDPNLPKGVENTGGLNYSSIINSNAESYSFTENSADGTATVTAINSLKLDDLNIKLTPGNSSSEEYYEQNAAELFPEITMGKPSEDDIRAKDLPLNSHKFSYSDFNFRPGVNVTSNAKVKSLSVTLKADSEDVNITRIMYGGGMNVNYKSAADTEYAKHLCGVKEDNNAGYWYNDVGPEVLQECTEAGIEWGNGVGEFEPGGGSDLAKQEMGGYLTVTWDVPESVLKDATFKTKDQISFQLWYAEAAGKALEGGLTIVSAALTYEESITFPYTGQASVSNAGSGTMSDPVSIDYADFGMEYEKTADVYAVQFDVTLPNDANQAVIGMGTSVLEKLGITDNWYQSTEYFQGEGEAADSSSALFFWEKTTAGSRPDPNDTEATVAPYKDPTGTKTYTYMWVLSPKVGEGMNNDPETGTVKRAHNYINAEEEGSHLSMGVYYAGLGMTTSDTFSVDNVTVFYKADDKENSVKGDKFEEVLSVVDSIDVQIGETATLEINVPGCTILSSNSSKASASLDENGKDAIVKGKNVTEDEPVVLTITTPGGQVAEVQVNVLAEVTEESTDTTATTGSSTTTTTSTSSTGTATEPDYKANALYGDVNLDGLVDLADAIKLNKACAGQVELSGQALENADCEYDGDLTAGDALALLQFLVRKISSIGPGADL